MATFDPYLPCPEMGSLLDYFFAGILSILDSNYLICFELCMVNYLEHFFR